MNPSIKESIQSIVNAVYRQLNIENVNIIVQPTQDPNNPSVYRLNTVIAAKELQPSIRDLEPYRKVSVSDLEQQCTLCLCNYEAGEFKRTLPCSHVFHKKCVDKWIIEKNTCPNCRAKII